MVSNPSLGKNISGERGEGRVGRQLARGLLRPNLRSIFSVLIRDLLWYPGYFQVSNCFFELLFGLKRIQKRKLNKVLPRNSLQEISKCTIMFQYRKQWCLQTFIDRVTNETLVHGNIYLLYVLFKKRAGVYYHRVFKPDNTRLRVLWTASTSPI